MEKHIQTQPEIELVCKLHAEGCSMHKIAEELSLFKGKKVSKITVWHFLNSQKNQPAIRKHAEKYLTNPFAVKIAHKRVRLEDLNKLRLKILRTIEKLSRGKDYVPDKKINKFLRLAKRLIEVEIAGREEIEKKPDMIALFQRIGPYSEVSDDELHKELKEIDTKLLIIRRGELSNKKNPHKEDTQSTDTG